MAAVAELHVDRRVLHHGRCVVVPALESGQIDEGFDQGSHRAVRIERPVEAVVADIASADDRDDIAALGRGDDRCAFEGAFGVFALPVEPCKLVLEGALRLVLCTRVEAGVDAQAGLGQILIVVVPAQGAAHEIEIRGVIRTRGPPRDSERPVRGGTRIGRGDDALLCHLAQHEVAPGQRALRMAPRIVVGRPAYDRHQQRCLRQIELRERLTEIELAREPETVDGAIAVLAEEDLVDVGIHEIGLGEVRIERHRHHGLTQLARERLPRAEEVTAHQLLSEGAAALLDLSRAHVDPRGAQHPFGIDTVVAVELAVLDRLERLRQQRRHLIGAEHDAILTVYREDAADQQRLEPQHRQLVSRTIVQAFDALRPGYRDGEALRRARLIRKARWTEGHLHLLTRKAVGTGVIGPVGAPVVQALQLVLEPGERQRQTRVQLERRRVYLRRERPAATLELLHHQVIEVQRIEHGGEQDSAENEEQPALQTNSSAAGGRRLYSELMVRP